MLKTNSRNLAIILVFFSLLAIETQKSSKITSFFIFIFAFSRNFVSIKNKAAFE
jgi:hypothetical protein